MLTALRCLVLGTFVAGFGVWASEGVAAIDPEDPVAALTDELLEDGLSADDDCAGGVEACSMNALQLRGLRRSAFFAERAVQEPAPLEFQAADPMLFVQRAGKPGGSSPEMSSIHRTTLRLGADPRDSKLALSKGRVGAGALVARRPTLRTTDGGGQSGIIGHWAPATLAMFAFRHSTAPNASGFMEALRGPALYCLTVAREHVEHRFELALLVSTMFVVAVLVVGAYLAMSAMRLTNPPADLPIARGGRGPPKEYGGAPEGRGSAPSAARRGQPPPLLNFTGEPPPQPRRGDSDGSVPIATASSGLGAGGKQSLRASKIGQSNNPRLKGPLRTREDGDVANPARSLEFKAGAGGRAPRIEEDHPQSG
eukprot:CAMPEP_0170217202 /NCGR_PEP_ID=MMETSP0116_2-20130129/8263_1 /TAXON_ID=400756 /ORGANISM="Durinskia baltica, Strain CSIRO CS-38" /LENGTH=367 /DNA_ID=CAMNT_0010467829 /DNA_START=120 /DNA_END=1224 /DNA_ORIENTATION=+